MKKGLIPLALIFCAVMAVSCSGARKSVYFDNIGDTTLTNIQNIDLEPVIQKNDILSITVSSLNEKASQMFNTPNIAAAGANAAGGISASTGYLVSQDGNIQFPMLGNIQAAGITKKQLKDNITKELLDRKLLIDPIVNIRFLNFRVTVLGEVARPTVITVANEKISILEAIGLAGDLTIFAQRDKVLLIREEAGEKIIKRLNLNTNEIFASPYYYLKSNDIIYAEPNKAKLYTANATRQNLPLILSALSIITIVITRVFF